MSVYLSQVKDQWWGHYEHGNECLGYIQSGYFLKQTNNYYLFKPMSTFIPTFQCDQSIQGVFMSECIVTEKRANIHHGIQTSFKCNVISDFVIFVTSSGITKIRGSKSSNNEIQI